MATALIISVHTALYAIAFYDRTPLLWAAENGNEAIVKLLPATGKVDAGSKDTYCQTPLLRATGMAIKIL